MARHGVFAAGSFLHFRIITHGVVNCIYAFQFADIGKPHFGKVRQIKTVFCLRDVQQRICTGIIELSGKSMRDKYGAMAQIRQEAEHAKNS